MASDFAFFLRSRPRDADIEELIIRHKRVFIGYAIHLAGTVFQPEDLRSCLLDLGSDIHDAVSEGDWLRQYTAHHNLVRDVAVGSVVVIPRPASGIVHIARIAGPFELIGNPPWADEYRSLRRAQFLEANDPWHVADVCQSWPIDDLKSVPLALVPAWIRRSFGGRSSFGRLYDHHLMGSAAAALRQASTGHIDRRDWTLDEDHVIARLLTDFNPTSFEHLAVSLLQLENPDQVWVQTGGAGDGGIDGIGYDPETGRMTGLLQCKFAFWGNPAEYTSSDTVVPTYLAALEHADGLVGKNFLNRHIISQLVIKYRDRLPQAQALRVGKYFDN